MANKNERRFKVKGTRYDHKRSDGIDRWRAREVKLNERLSPHKRAVQHGEHQSKG